MIKSTVMSSARPCYLSPTRWCNLRECFSSKNVNVKCKLEREKEITDGPKVYVGSHLVLDLWEATNLDDVAFVEATLITCAQKIKATVLNFYFHQFENGGVTGYLALAESHISIHTWPEHNYAAVDIFTCSDVKPHAAILILKEAFNPSRIVTQELQRGIQ